MSPVLSFQQIHKTQIIPVHWKQVTLKKKQPKNQSVINILSPWSWRKVGKLCNQAHTHHLRLLSASTKKFCGWSDWECTWRTFARTLPRASRQWLQHITLLTVGRSVENNTDNDDDIYTKKTKKRNIRKKENEQVNKQEWPHILLWFPQPCGGVGHCGMTSSRGLHVPTLLSMWCRALGASTSSSIYTHTLRKTSGDGRQRNVRDTAG